MYCFSFLQCRSECSRKQANPELTGLIVASVKRNWQTEDLWTTANALFQHGSDPESSNKMFLSASKICFSYPNINLPPFWGSVPILRNMTIFIFVPFTTGHLDSGISAEHMLHSKQPQHNTAQDNKTQPGAKAFPKSKCCSQPKVSSIQVQLSLSLCSFPRGALNPTAFLRWIRWNGLTHSRFTRSTSALLALTIDKETEHSLEK